MRFLGTVTTSRVSAQLLIARNNRKLQRDQYSNETAKLIIYIYKNMVFLIFPKENSLVNTIIEYDSL